MAEELVPVKTETVASHLKPVHIPGGQPEIDGTTTWELPPSWESEKGRAKPVHGRVNRERVKTAAADAERAKRTGDKSLAEQRTQDAADLQQSRWDWGNPRTWAWIAVMFFGFLTLVAICYHLPTGQSATPPPIRVY